MRKMEKGDTSVMDLQNFTKSESGHLYLRHNLDPNIMTLAQAVLGIFCSQASIGL